MINVVNGIICILSRASFQCNDNVRHCLRFFLTRKQMVHTYSSVNKLESATPLPFRIRHRIGPFLDPPDWICNSGSLTGSLSPLQPSGRLHHPSRNIPTVCSSLNFGRSRIGSLRDGMGKWQESAILTGYSPPPKWEVGIWEIIITPLLLCSAYSYSY